MGWEDTLPQGYVDTPCPARSPSVGSISSLSLIRLGLVGDLELGIVSRLAFRRGILVSGCWYHQPGTVTGTVAAFRLQAEPVDL